MNQFNQRRFELWEYLWWGNHLESSLPWWYWNSPPPEIRFSLDRPVQSVFWSITHYCTVYPWSCIFWPQSFHIHCSLCSCYFLPFLTTICSNNFFKLCSTTKILCCCCLLPFRSAMSGCMISFRRATFSSPWTRLSTVREDFPNNSKQTTIFWDRGYIPSFCFLFPDPLNTEAQLKQHIIGWILLHSCHINTKGWEVRWEAQWYLHLYHSEKPTTPSDIFQASLKSLS